jgi:hypothetical protein
VVRFLVSGEPALHAGSFALNPTTHKNFWIIVIRPRFDKRENLISTSTNLLTAGSSPFHGASDSHPRTAALERQF